MNGNHSARHGPRRALDRLACLPAEGGPARYGRLGVPIHPSPAGVPSITATTDEQAAGSVAEEAR
ncbi:hypothetical protein [Micromonospora luteifusca]|uniref:hypothetical protein n=1 Tax=Micromonospora luteifusca TaxID=709860 RepID=UPI001956CF18|nr:hypothetical protein [Micromonospora luteifusca]